MTQLLTSSVWLWETGNTELKIISVSLLLGHCWSGWIYNGKSQTIFILQQMPVGSLQMSWLLAQTLSAWSWSDIADVSEFVVLGPHDCRRQHKAHHSAPHRAAVLPDSSEPCLLLLGQPNTNCWADLSLNSGGNCSWCWLLNAMRHTEKSDALKVLSCTLYPLAWFSLPSSFTAHNTLGWFLTNELENRFEYLPGLLVISSNHCGRQQS